MYTLTQLEIFIRVAEAGSFNKAAEESFITASAVMKHINNLEKEVGAPLFQRTYRGQQLTKAGERLYKDGVKILELCKNSLIKAQEAAKQDFATIRLGSNIMYPPLILDNLWKEIQEKHPEIKIELVPFDTAPTSEGFTMPQPGTSVDLVVTAYDEKVLELMNVRGLEVTRVPLCAIMSVNHRLASKETLRPEDFDGETLYVIRKGRSDDVKDFTNNLLKNGVNVTLEEIQSYGVEIYNRCASSDAMLLGMGQDINIHPMIKRIPIECEQNSAFGFIYANEPTKAVEYFVEIVHGMVKAGIKDNEL